MTLIYIILNSLFLLILLIFSGYWAFVFTRRINCFKKYQRGVARCLSDDSGLINKQFYYHYETEIKKYILLLLVTSSEIIAGIFFFASDTIQHYLTYRQLGNSTLELPFSDCVSYDNPALNQINIIYTGIPLLNGLTSIARSAELFLIAFSACLMNYLILRMKEIRHSYNSFNSRMFLTATAILSVINIFTGFIQYAFIISILFFSILVIAYFCIFVHTAKRFKLALHQRALERLIQHGSNKDEMRQYRYCKHTINILCCGYLFVLISEYLLHIPVLLTSALFYGNCYFPFNLFPSLGYIIKTEKAIEEFIKVLQYIELIGRTIGCSGVLVVLLPFLIITICIWIKHIIKRLRGNKKIKYTTVNKSLGELFITT